MQYGEGSISEEKKRNGKSYSPKHWRVVASYTVLDAEGKPKRKRVARIVKGSKSDAKDVLEKILAEHDEHGRPLTEVEQAKAEEEQAAATTLTELIELWDKARHVSGKASEKTMRDNRNQLRQVEKHLGETKVQAITPQMIEAAYAAIKEERHIGNTTLEHLHTLLKGVFEKGVDYDIIVKNPCRKVEAPQRDDPQRRSLTREEAARMLHELDNAEAIAYTKLRAQEERRTKRGKTGTRHMLRGLHHISLVIGARIGLATGMRRGEVFALTWGAINLNHEAVRVDQSILQTGEIKTPKTQAGVRTIAIDWITNAHLTEWKAAQAVELAKLGIEQNDDTPMCCSDTGGWYRVDNFTHWWAKWRKEHGFPDVKFHELRHTQATQLLGNRVDVATVAKRLGHANPSITLSWYAHAIPENDHAAANLVGSLFSGQQPPTSSFAVISNNPDDCSQIDDIGHETPTNVPAMSRQGVIPAKTKQARKSA